MTEIIELIKERKWDTVIAVILITALMVTIPLTVKYSVNAAIKSNLDPIMESIQKIDSRVERIEKMEISEITDRGIAAYKKIFDIEQLEKSTQNAASIQIALRTPESRAILFQIDHDRTIMFENYFCTQ